MADDSTSPPVSWLGLPIVATLARLLCQELTLQNEYLRVENKMLRSKLPKRLQFTDDERRCLVDAALAMGCRLLGQAVSIVRPETILAWQRRLQKRKWDFSHRVHRGPGRPRTSQHVETLICNMARENTWGYRRIRDELAKLGIEVSKTCVGDILRRNGLPPSPERKGLTWRESLSRHADSLLCADLLTQEVWTLRGLKTAYVLFVIHLRTRTVLLAQATFSPHSAWMQQQVRNVLWECDELAIEPRFFVHDNDACFCNDFDQVLRNASVTPAKTPFQAPDANAHAERWVRSLRQECPNHLILFGLDRLQRVVDEYRRFFNAHRPHQGIAGSIPKDLGTVDTSSDGQSADGVPSSGAVACEEFLGGLLRSYYRQAA